MDIDQSLEDIIKNKRKANARKAAGRNVRQNPQGSRNTMKMTTKKTNITTRSLQQRGGRGARGGYGRGGRGQARGGRGRGAIAAQVQNLSHRAAAQLRTPVQVGRRGRGGRGGLTLRRGTQTTPGLTLTTARRGRGKATQRAQPAQQLQQAAVGMRSQQKQARAVVVSPAASTNIQVSVKGNYSRQVDTDPVGVEISNIPIHMTSMTTNIRFSKLEASHTPPVAPPSSSSAQQQRPPISTQSTQSVFRRIRLRRGGSHQ